MAIKFNDTYIDSIARAHLDPSERVVAKAAGVHKPIWSFGVRFFWSTYLLLATDRRLVMVEHRRGLFYDRVERIEAMPWSEVGEAKVSGLLKKKLKLAFANGRAKLALALPGLFGPLPRATDGAKALVSAWQQGKTLPPPAQHGALPPTNPGVYAQPQAF